MSVKTVEIDAKKPRAQDVLAFMRAGGSPDNEIVMAAESAIEKIFSVSKCRACFVRCPIEFLGHGRLRIGVLEIHSESLSKRLSLCSEAYVFAASVGTEVDRIIRVESARSSLFGLCADAAGSAMVESACDKFNEAIDGICRSEGKRTVARFSAGYGDMSLEYQRDICEMLETKINIGVSLGGGGMMMPTKSVTAIIGVY